MKESFVIVAVLSMLFLFAITGLIMTGNVIHTKVYWPSHEVPFDPDKVLTFENFQTLRAEFGIEPQRATDLLSAHLSTDTCFNNDGSFGEEAFTKGFAVDRSGTLAFDECKYIRAEDKSVLREAYCRDGFLNIRWEFCNCQYGACVR